MGFHVRSCLAVTFSVYINIYLSTKTISSPIINISGKYLTYFYQNFSLLSLVLRLRKVVLHVTVMTYELNSK